jgi:uncharacterized protein (DUF924 family)
MTESTSDSVNDNVPERMADNMKADVLDFWFNELAPAQHWDKDPALDATIEQHFGAVHTAAAAGELWEWRTHAEGRLAEIIVLDQFSRNIFRDSPAAFFCDPMALVLAQEAVAIGVDKELNVQKRSFLYLPYMHSESLRVHEQAMRLFDQPGLDNNYEFELKHLAIIKRFGRYPHRNALLNRSSTNEEIEFLKQPGSSF